MSRQTVTTAQIEYSDSYTGTQRDELAGYYVVEIKGICGLLKGHDEALAHFGSFRKYDLTIRYTATVWADNDRIYHDADSEFCDDLIALRRGNVDWIH